MIDTALYFSLSLKVVSARLLLLLLGISIVYCRYEYEGQDQHGNRGSSKASCAFFRPGRISCAILAKSRGRAETGLDCGARGSREHDDNARKQL